MNILLLIVSIIYVFILSLYTSPYLLMLLILKSITNTFKIFMQSNWFLAIIIAIVSFFVFIFVIIIRITTPRFKLESLTKMGWLYGFLAIALSVVFFFIGYYLFL